MVRPSEIDSFCRVRARAESPGFAEARIIGFTNENDIPEKKSNNCLLLDRPEAGNFWKSSIPLPLETGILEC